MTSRCPALFLLLFLSAAAPYAALAGVGASGSVKTVWDRIMEEQGAASLRKGYALMGAENYQAAADEFFKAVQASPADATPRLFYGTALYWLGEPAKAMKEFEEALRLDPKNSMAFQLRGIVKARDGLYKEALEDFTQAEAWAPDRADVKMNAGSVCHALGNFARALDYFREAVRLDPGNPLFRYQLGLFYSRLGRYEQAAAELQRALELYPGYEDAVFELAALRERDGRLSEAVKLYRRALNLKPGDSAARFRLCWALFKSRRYAEIGKYLQQAFLLAPANERGGISMALAYAGAKPSEAPPAEDGAPRGPLYSALNRVAPDQDVRVQVELLEIPRNAGLQKAGLEGAKGGKLAAALAAPKVNYTRREYFLPASSKEERLRRAAEVSAEADKLLKGAGAAAEARLSFNLETSRPKAKDDGEKAKALYKPRDVGNDMGLWVMGDNWLETVSDAAEEMEGGRWPDRPELRLVRGLGSLLLGEPGAALEDFEGGGADAALGRSAAWVAAGDPAKALEACGEALKADPGNRTALANRGWLGGGK